MHYHAIDDVAVNWRWGRWFQRCAHHSV